MEGKRKSVSHSQESKKKRTSQNLSLRPTLSDENVKKEIREAWVNVRGTNCDDFKMISSPFKCCVLNNLIQEQSFFKRLSEELSSVDMIEKNNDLYQFHQTKDISNFHLPTFVNLQDFLQHQCRPWIQDVTGIELSAKLAVTYSCYKDTDYLLCHDDKCEDRKIAFILYLNQDWRAEDGGALQLYKTDDSGQPTEVVESIIPEFNKFVFFEVTDKSFHQVAEVITPDRSRMTINGWFHSTVLCKQNPFVECLAPKKSPLPQCKSEILLDYINPAYLAPNYHKQMSGIFEEESQISLSKFLKDDLYEILNCAIMSNEIVWEKKGPANRRCYFVPVYESLPASIRSFIDFLSSSPFFTFLHEVTKLDLCPSSEKKEKKGNGTSSSSDNGASGNPKFSFEIQMWESGCYTLVNDDDPVFQHCALDAIIYFLVDDVQEECGGFTSYIARDEDLELLTVVPTKNALALSYRDNETLRFVKYINHYFTGKFYTIAFVYYE